MYLQILLLSTIACAYSRTVLDQSKSADHLLRQKRTAFFDYEKQAANNYLYNAQQQQKQNTLYNIEDDVYNGSSGDLYRSNEDENVSYSSDSASADSKSVYEDINTSHRDSTYQPTKQVAGTNYRNIGTSSVIAKRATPSVSRRSFDSDHYEKIQKLSDKYEDDKIIQKRYSQPLVDEEEHHYAPPKYDFKYTVHDVEHHDIKHHQEERDGDHTVGEYSLLQPDGTILTVKYTVHGDEGFNAIVSKSDDAHDFSEHHHHKEYEHPKLHDRPKIHDHRFEQNDF